LEKDQATHPIQAFLPRRAQYRCVSSWLMGCAMVSACVRAGQNFLSFRGLALFFLSLHPASRACTILAQSSSVTIAEEQRP